MQNTQPVMQFSFLAWCVDQLTSPVRPDLAVGDAISKHIEDSSWVRVRDKDIFSRRVTGRPSDEGARSVRNEQGKDSLSRTRRLEEFCIFQFEVVTVLNDDIFTSKHVSSDIEIFLHRTSDCKSTSNRMINNSTHPLTVCPITQENVRYTTFEGAMEELKINDMPVGLWNFVSQTNLKNRGVMVRSVNATF